MYISKKKRQQIRNKFGGLCAYSGTPLEDDFQIDHIKPVIRSRVDGTSMFPELHKDDNLVPTQRIINHYKGSLSLEVFRDWFLGGLHERLAKLPKKPRTERSVKRAQYLRKVASYFNITEDTPFTGKFYFEKVTDLYYCVNEIEGKEKCKKQCNHCKEYYNPLEQ